MKRLIKNKILVNFIIFCVVFSFLGTAILPNSYAQMPGGALTLLGLPGPGTPVALSDAFSPPMMYGLKVFPEEPLRFDFIMDKGDAGLDAAALRAQYAQLMKYFLTALTVPEEDLWVNLSPQEPDRIAPEAFGQTEMGRDLLAQDYLLKQLTASLMNPDEEIGKEFWQRVRKEIRAKYGDTDIPVDTFNKVWIVPDEATVYTKNSVAFITRSHLKVMLEEDYFQADTRHQTQDTRENSCSGVRCPVSGVSQTGEQTKEIIREIILPEIEKEVNEGKHFAPLRQVFHAMILATWFKKHLKESFLGKVYVGQKRIAGVDVEDKAIKEKIYGRYLEAFKTGVYDFVREEYDGEAQEVVPRHYFSGGVVMALGPEAAFNAGMAEVYAETQALPNPGDLDLQMVPSRIDPEGVDLENPADGAMLANAQDRELVRGFLGKVEAHQTLEEAEAAQVRAIFQRLGFDKLWDQAWGEEGFTRNLLLRRCLAGMDLLLEYDSTKYERLAVQVERAKSAQRVIASMSQAWIIHLMSHFGKNVALVIRKLERLDGLEARDRAGLKGLQRSMERITEGNSSVGALLSDFNIDRSGPMSLFLLERIKIFLQESYEFHDTIVQLAQNYQAQDPSLAMFTSPHFVEEALFLKNAAAAWEADGGKVDSGTLNPVREILAVTHKLGRDLGIRVEEKEKKHWAIDNLNQIVVGQALEFYGLFQVLFENAVHARHPQREPVIELNVSQKDAGDHVVLGLVISDNGIGMTSEQLANARAGIRFSTQGSIETTGHGMGLLAAGDIVRRNGGTMTIDSVEGHGTTFRITLPLAKADAAASQSTDTAMLTDAQAKELIERVYSEEKLRTVLVDSPKHIKYSIDDLVALWQPFLSQVMNESGMDAAVFLEKAAQGDLPEEVQERLKAVFDRKNEMSHDQEEIGFRPDFFRRYVTEKINGIFDHQKEKRVKILLGGSLELEASYVLKVVGGIFEKACHDRGLNVDEEKKNWQISLVGYSIDSQGLLRTLTAIRWKLFEEWLRLEYMDLVDEKQNKRIIDEKPDIIICSRSLYLGHTTSFYDIVTVPYAKQYPGDRSKGKNQLEARRRFMKAAYQSLPDDGVLLSEEPWVFQPASVYAPFHYVDLPSKNWGLGSGIFLKSTGGNPTASSIIDELRRESKRTPVSEIQDWLIGGTHDYHWDPADAYQLVGLKEKGADATGMISYDIFIQDFRAPDHRGATVGSLEVGLEWLDDHDEKMRMRVAVSDQADVHIKTFLHSFVKQVELKLSSGSVIELHSETEMETAAGDAQGLKRLFAENWLYDVEVKIEPLGDGRVEVVVKGTVDKSRIERETDFGGDGASEAVPAGSPATVSGTKDSAMLAGKRGSRGIDSMTLEEALDSGLVRNRGQILAETREGSEAFRQWYAQTKAMIEEFYMPGQPVLLDPFSYYFENATGDVRKLRWLVSQKNRALVLEIGAGSTHDARMFAQYNSQMNVIALDPYGKLGTDKNYSGYAKMFREKTLELQRHPMTNAVALQGDLSAALSFPDASIDTLVFINPSDAAIKTLIVLLREFDFVKKLKPDAKILIKSASGVEFFLDLVSAYFDFWKGEGLEVLGVSADAVGKDWGQDYLKGKIYEGTLNAQAGVADGAMLAQTGIEVVLGRKVSKQEMALITLLLPQEDELPAGVSLWRWLGRTLSRPKGKEAPAGEAMTGTEEKVLAIFKKIGELTREGSVGRKELLDALSRFFFVFQKSKDQLAEMSLIDLIDLAVTSAPTLDEADNRLLLLMNAMGLGLVKQGETLDGLREKLTKDQSAWSDFPASRREPKKQGQVNILVVDDYAPDREEVARPLRKQGYVVGVAVNGQDALAQLEKKLPDLIVTDWMMPGMDGLELIRHLKEQLPWIPVVFRSGDLGGANYYELHLGGFIRTAFSNVIGVSGKVGEKNVALKQVADYFSASDSAMLSGKELADRLSVAIHELQKAGPDRKPALRQEVARLAKQADDITRQTYDRMAERYNKLRGTEVVGLEKIILEKFLTYVRAVKKFQGVGRLDVLDAGTGLRDLLWLSNQAKVRAVGIDVSKPVIDFLKGDPRIQDKVDLSVMDMRQLEFEDNSFHGVRAQASLLHLPIVDREQGADVAVQEAFRVLEPGGIYSVGVKAETATYQGFSVMDTAEGLGERFYQFYSKEMLRDILERNGFVVLEIYDAPDHRGIQQLIAFAQKPGIDSAMLAGKDGEIVYTGERAPLTGVKAVVFDMDGVVIKTEAIYREMFAKTLYTEILGLPKTQENLQAGVEYYDRHVMGEHERDILQPIIDAARQADPSRTFLSVEEYVTRYEDARNAVIKEALRTDPESLLVEGVVETIRELRERGKIVLLATNNQLETAQVLWNRISAFSLFDEKRAGDGLDKKMAAIGDMLAARGIALNETVFVDDSRSSIRAARAKFGSDLFIVNLSAGKKLVQGAVDVGADRVINRNFGDAAAIKKLFVSAGIDSAMLGNKELGGIDMNPTKMNLREEGEAVDFVVPPGLEDFENLPITGFTPVILDVIPVADISLLLASAE